MDNKLIEEIRNKYKERNEKQDGGAGSGNWGHVGRPGKLGGSAKGGGNAFRMVTRDKNTKKEVYTSQAKIRMNAKTAIKNAAEVADTAASKLMKSFSKTAIKKYESSLRRLERAKTAAQKVEMRQKSADANKYVMHPEKYWAVSSPNENASRNILADYKGRGKITGGVTGGRARGTKESVTRTFPKKKKGVK